MNGVQFLSVLGVSILGSGGVSEIIIYFWRKQIDQKYAKELETFKAQQQTQLDALSALLEKRNYVSKVRFDAEFAIHQLIFDVVFELVLTNNSLWPRIDRLPKDEDATLEIYKDRYNKAADAHDTAMRSIEKSAPFITKELYENLKIILEKCRMQLEAYTDIRLQDQSHVLGAEVKPCMERQDSINEDHSTLILKAREYLKSLDVIP